jgi:hypothetical protein
LGRALHPAYSPDISPCDFWAFETIKWIIKDRRLQGPEDIVRAIQEGWNRFTFEDCQNVFKSWMERLTWVIANNGKYFHYKNRLESHLIWRLWDRLGSRSCSPPCTWLRRMKISKCPDPKCFFWLYLSIKLDRRNAWTKRWMG